MNIVILCGGISSEREISLRTSTKVATALQEKGHNVVMADVFFGVEEMPAFEDQKDFKAEADKLREKNDLVKDIPEGERHLFGPNVLELCKKADIVFIGLHGENGEDGKVQAALDEAGVKYTGSDADSSALAMSKSKTKDIVAEHIRMPDGIVIKHGEENSDMPAPCVIKPDNGGSSIGVILVMDDSDFASSLKEGFGYCKTVLAEEFIKGRELTQAAIGDRVLPPVEICPDADTWYDYNNKYNGKTKEVCPADIPEETLKEMSEKTLEFGRLLGLSVYYRIDYLLDENGTLYALEANSLPGMTDTSLVPQEAAAVGIDYPDLCELIIEESLKKYN